MDRLEAAALRIAMETRRNLRARIGSGKTTGITRPMYKSGPYAGQYWTARNFGELVQSIRVVRKRTAGGKALSKKLNIRVYAGHKAAYYARIFEYSKPFMRPAIDSTLAEVREILGVK